VVIETGRSAHSSLFNSGQVTKSDWLEKEKSKMKESKLTATENYFKKIKL